MDALQERKRNIKRDLGLIVIGILMGIGGLAIRHDLQQWNRYNSVVAEIDKLQTSYQLIYKYPELRELYLRNKGVLIDRSEEQIQDTYLLKYFVK